MARNVYSTCFVSLGPGIGPFTYSYNVPPHYTGVLRDMTFEFHGASGSFAYPFFAVTVDPGPVTVWKIGGRAISNRVYQWTGREIFSGEEALTVMLPAPQCSFRANGYLLSI